MMKNKYIRTLAAVFVVVLCMTAFAVPAYAGGTDPDPEPIPEATAEPTPTPEPETTTGGMEPEGKPLTPEGNATLVDDYYGDKQLITVTTKAGNYFYILIDRANEDKETAVHFLNQVDEADLMALMEDAEKEEAPAVCSCTKKCEAGAVNTACPICKTNMTECTGPQAQEPEATPEPEAKGGGAGGLMILLVVLLAGGGAALYYFKVVKPKQSAKGGTDLDEYDFDEDDEGAEDEEPAEDKSDGAEPDKEDEE